MLSCHLGKWGRCSTMRSGRSALLRLAAFLAVAFGVCCGSLGATVTTTTIDPLSMVLAGGFSTVASAPASAMSNATDGNGNVSTVAAAAAAASGVDDGTADDWFEVFKLVLKASIMLLIIIASICGNLLVIVSVMRVRKLR